MGEHNHINAVDALAAFAAVLVLGAIWRTTAYALAERKHPLGPAMLFVF